MTVKPDTASRGEPTGWLRQISSLLCLSRYTMLVFVFCSVGGAQHALAWPDLVVVKSGPSTAMAGETIGYTLTYTNQGRLSDSGVKLVDTLPSQLTVLTNTLSGGSFRSNTITWTIGSLAVGQGGVFSFEAVVKTNAAIGTYFTNTGYISGSQAEDNTNNNTSRVVTQVVGSTGPPTRSFCLAVLARQSVTLHGNMLIDSYNSLDPNQSTDGQYDPAKRGDAGDTASAGSGVNLITDTGHTSVYGHFYTSPSGTVTISGNASVGSLPWVDGGNRGIQPGWYSNNLQVTIQDATLPPFTFLPLPQNPGVVNGTNYSYVLTTGKYSLSSFSLSGSMCINGNVVLYFPNGLSISGQGLIYIAPGASLTVYLGGTASLSGQGTINGTGFATNCAYIGLPSCLTIQNSGGSQFVGTIYAPEAAVTLTGGGNQAVNYAGAVVANTISITGDFQFHYDQGLCGECIAPIILIPPADQAVCIGDTAIFNVHASGTGLAYQWYMGTSRLSGQTNSTLTLTNVQPAGAAVYSVVVSGACGAAQTNSANLTVNSQVLVVNPPVNQSACLGGMAQFSVNATGTALEYQWYKGTSLLPGQTLNTLAITNVQPTDAAVYSVVVIGACGTAQTNSASLTVNAPVLVVTPPANQTVCPGDAAQFSINATGSALAYQWYKGASLLTGKTGNSLTLTNVQAGDAGVYSVVVSGACGTAQTNSATLTVNAPVLVVTPPANQAVCPGDTALFSINATGSALAYQWYKGASLLTGKTGNSLTLTNVQAGDAGVYSVVVSGVCGTAQTNSATLTVNAPVLVVTPPANQTVCPGDTALFSVSATGTGLTYQWSKGLSLLPGQTSSSLTLTNVQATDAAIYSVVVSGACGTAQTNSATLMVNAPVLVVTPPVNQAVCPGDTAQFSINATGSALAYQWYKGASLLTGKTGNSLTLTNVQAGDAGVYSVVVSGVCGTAQTNSATLTVNAPVLVVTPPANQAVCPGDTAQFSINAAGSALAYQWYKGASLLTGKTGNSLTLTNVQATDAAIYSVVVSGACGTAQTNSASLTVNAPVLVVTPPANQAVCPGDTAQFSINATGSALAYQWYKGASLLTGKTGNSLTLTNVQAADAAIYFVVVSGACGTAQTNSASLTVNAPVLVVTPPANQTVCPGDTAQFSINATGSALAYQWYKGASLLTGKTGNSLTLTNVQAADAAIYSVVVSGVCGIAQTNSASLTVNSPVLVVTAPANQSVCPGGMAQFSINATGTALVYQWYKGPSLLAGQTGNSLNLTNVQATDAAIYSVVVSGACGTAQTNSASLVVNSQVLVVTPPANQTVCPGDTAQFSINAAGSALAYQWYKGASLLTGKTGNSLTLTNVQATDAAIYSVVVSGACGTAQTNSASLTVNAPVLVVTPPANQAVCPGDTAQFSINATGSALAYQWYKGASLLTGKTGNSLTLTNVQAADAAIYFVVVSGACGTAQTNSASLTVNAPVLVVTPPANQTVCPGDTAQFSINATGSALAYQWYKGASLLTGKTGNSLTLTNVQAADAAIYSVVVSGVCGIAQTNSASLTVNSPVLVVTAPANQSVCPGGMAQFSINATGTALVYQWYKGPSLLAGQTGNSLNLTNVQATDAAIYSVVVSGACGTAQTNSASLVVNSQVLVVTPPANQTVCPGDTAQFSINATGTALAYQWYKGASLLNQTGPNLILTNVQAADAATYSVVVSGACGTPQTNSASLTINSPVLVVTAPANQSVCPGNTAQFTINATGTALAYQWYKGPNLLTGQTGTSLTLTNVQATDAAIYSVVVSGACGIAQTNSANLTVNSPVLVVTPPANQTVCAGDTALFSINATGSALTYQWYKGTNLLNSQTASSLTLTNVQATDASIYSVVIGSACGTPQTNSASLTVNAPVLVITPPVNQSVCPGGTVQFSIDATGTTLAYQWYKGTSLLTSQNGSTLVLSNVQSTDAAIYSVVVSGACGTAQTNSASLVVNSPVLVVTPPANQTVCPGDTAQFSINATGTALAYQWYKGTSLLNQTGPNLILTNVQAADAATYSVVVSGGCGTAQTNSASLIVNSPVLVVTAPANQSVCPDNMAQFSISASGTALAYQWYKGPNLLAGQTGNSLTLTNVQATDAAIYSVVVSGACGTAQTNTAALVVNSRTTATPLAGGIRNPGDSITFSTIPSGTGPFTFSWTKNGSLIAGATGSSLTLTNLGYGDAGLYAVQVSGLCNSATQSATLTINFPPTVTIISPTNGAVFLAPANFTVLADAEDIDGVVTNVVFYLSGTNNLGNSTNAPYFVEQTNLPPGSYTYTAKAWDDRGLSATSAPVTISVQAHAPLSIVSAIHFDPQTGLFDQTVRVTNPTYSTFDAVRIYVGNLTNNAVLWNATGTTNGLSYVDSHAGVAPNSYVDFVLEYYVPSRITPNPTLTPVLIPPPQGGGVAVAGFQQHINRALMLPNKTYLIEFASLTNRLYYIEYTQNLQLWNTAMPAIRGNGTRIQWIDNGQPKTDSSPAVTPQRFYRVILLP